MRLFTYEPLFQPLTGCSIFIPSKTECTSLCQIILVHTRKALHLWPCKAAKAISRRKMWASRRRPEKTLVVSFLYVFVLVVVWMNLRSRDQSLIEPCFCYRRLDRWPRGGRGGARRFGLDSVRGVRQRRWTRGNEPLMVLVLVCFFVLIPLRLRAMTTAARSKTNRARKSAAVSCSFGSLCQSALVFAKPAVS